MAEPIVFQRRGGEVGFAAIAPPPVLRVPVMLRQGRAARAPGTRVAAGEPLCGSGMGSATTPAPVAGIVGPLTSAQLLGGRRVDAIELRPLPAPQVPEPSAAARAELLPPTDLSTTPREARLRQWIDRFDAAGVAADRINSPDLLLQLAACVDRPADTLIVSVFDVESHVPSSAALLKNRAKEIAAAVALLAPLCGTERCLVVVGPQARGKNLAAFEPLVRAGTVRLVEVNGDYPLADPAVLLRTLTRRRLRPFASPTEQGVVLLDAAAAVAVGRLALHGEPMLTVPLAVRDHVTRSSYLLDAPLGMAVEDLCAVLEVPAKAAQLRGGELLRQLETPADAVVGPGELTLHISAAEPPVAPDPCIRCGWCIDACPTGVHPAQVLEAAQRSDRGLAEAYGLEACIGCGICTYVCPSRLPLLRAIRTFGPV